MFSKEEITAVLNILNRKGIQVDITEVNAIVLLKNRFGQELMKLSQPEKKETPKAVDASHIIKPAKKSK